MRGDENHPRTDAGHAAFRDFASSPAGGGVREGWLVGGVLAVLVVAVAFVGWQRRLQREARLAGWPLIRVAENGRVTLNGRALVPLRDASPPPALAEVEGAPPVVLDMNALAPPKDRIPGAKPMVFLYPRTGLHVYRLEPDPAAQTAPQPGGPAVPEPSSASPLGDLDKARPPGRGVAQLTLYLGREEAWFQPQPAPRFHGVLQFRGKRLVISDTELVRRKDCLGLVHGADFINQKSSTWMFQLEESTLFLEFAPDEHLREVRLSLPVPMTMEESEGWMRKAAPIRHGGGDEGGNKKTAS